ncbi:MAG: two-component regulator propeller domain-containing protein [Muribaculaceae bacterium]|nr:two-component regulator propeller domain-containing protein [Muribaculaceae bacterium]
MLIVLFHCGLCAGSRYNDKFFNTQVATASTVINCIIQDNSGLIWVGTSHGVYNYDGYSYHKVNASDSSVGTQINCIITGDNYLYIGSDNGLCIYNYRKDIIESNNNIQFPKDIRALAMLKGDLWIGTLNGLYKYNIKTKELKSIVNGLPHRTIYSLLVSESEDLYIGTYDGLAVKDKNSTLIRQIHINKDRKRNTLFVNSIVEDKLRKCLWIGTEGDLYRYDYNSSKAEEIKEFKNNTIKSLVLNGDNDLVLGTDNGLFIYSLGRVKHYIHDSRIYTSLLNNIVWNVYVDKDNNLWAGTDSGVSFMPDNGDIQIMSVSELTGKGDGNNFYSILKDSRGFLWLGGSNGLIKYDQSTGSSKWYNMEESKFYISHNRIRDIYEDRYNNLWIATDGSVNRYNYDTNQFEQYLIEDKSHKLNANWAYRIFEDDKDNIWVATFLGGVFIINREKLISTSDGICEADINITFGMPNAYINQMISTADGGAWVLLYKGGGGLYRMFPGGSKYKRIDINSLVEGYPSTLVLDKNNCLWCGYSGGIAILNNLGKLERTIKLSESFGGTIYAMCEIGEYIWISTADGVWRVNIENKKVELMPLPTKAYTSIYYDSVEDLVYLGTVDEIIKVKSQSLLPENKNRKLIITAISVNDKALVIANRSIRDIDKIELDHTQNHLIIEISDLNYSEGYKGRYLYKIEDVDKEWNLLSEGQNRILYSNLEAGVHRLVIKEYDAIEKGETIKKEIIIKIKPAWYNSLLARLIYAVLFIAFVVWVINFFRVKNRLKLERLDRDRTMEQAKSRMEFFTNISHELKTPLSMIIAPVAKMLSEVKDKATEKQLKLIQNNAVKLNSLIHRALEFNRIDINGDNLLIFSKVEVVEFCRSIFDVFKETHSDKNFIFNAAINKIYTEADVVKLESVFTNIIGNACKYSKENATIVLSILQNGNYLEVKISDDGIGIPQGDIPFIFQRLYQSTNTQGNNDGAGIGLYLAKSYLEMHKGSISVSSNEDIGTVFTITIPITIAEQEPNQQVEPEKGIIDKTRKTILIVDDNVAISDFLKDILSERYNCIVANNGKAGLAVCNGYIPDLMIIDLMMPIMDGIEMSKRIKKNVSLSTIPIIMLTAKDDVDTEAKSVDIGIDVFMSKPFDPSILLSRVGQLLNSKEEIRTQVRIEEITFVSSIEAESVDEKLLAEIIKVIEDHIADSDLSVNFVAEQLGITSKQLYRKIRQYIGITPVEYIKQIRMKKASMLLQQRKFNISEVMYMVGFSSSSYFSKCFQSQFGKTPRQYLDEMER